MKLQDALTAWDGKAVVARVHRETGTWMFVALHDDTMGKPVGGTRMRVYPAPADALVDAERLAEGMTLKWAAIGLPYGGGKAVLAPPDTLTGRDREAVLEAYADLLESLGGAFSTGEDLGTTPEDMAFLGARTRHVHGTDPDGGVARDPGPYTARGVLAAIRAALAHRFGTDDPSGRSVVVQGAGDVGTPLARALAEAGARVAVADVDEARAAALAGEIGGEVVAAETVYDRECDVLAPCAVGQVVSAATVPRLRCAVIAGAANNQLACPEDGDAVHARGIVFAPDFLANAGGAIAFGSLSLGVDDQDEIAMHIDAIQDRMAAVLSESAESGRPPHRVLIDQVESSLAEARALRGLGKR